MTSNVGAKNMTAAEGARLGFAAEDAEDAEGRFERIRQAVLAELRRTFRPEFINRIDEIVIFRHLDVADFVSIAAIMAKKLADALSEKGIALTVTDAALSLIAEKSYSEKYGARNMRRYMEKHLEDPLADQIIRQYDVGVSSATVDVQDGELAILCRA